MKKPNKTLDVFSENQKQMIAKTLINLREVNFLTQTDIAHHLHLSSSTISHYEKGITVPPTEIIFRLAEFYDVTTDYILGRCASKTNLNDTYALKLTNKMTIGDAVEIMTKINDAEREHLAYFIEVIGKSKK
ncbi:helix-turn-helix domain-containing protein [Ruminococcus sp.]|uniref:helix-turn-helix domain-containing protein n=1 Tax=Ruminococcus sp. TaxID=41978 RepID=UPI002FD93CB2